VNLQEMHLLLAVQADARGRLLPRCNSQLPLHNAAACFVDVSNQTKHGFPASQTANNNKNHHLSIPSSRLYSCYAATCMHQLIYPNAQNTMPDIPQPPPAAQPRPEQHRLGEHKRSNGAAKHNALDQDIHIMAFPTLPLSLQYA
jgi:hypothetical protein